METLSEITMIAVMITCTALFILCLYWVKTTYHRYVRNLTRLAMAILAMIATMAGVVINLINQ